MNEQNTTTELFTALQSLSDAIPEMRVGQLVAAVGELCADLHGRGLWDASNAELLETVWQFQRNFEAATVGVTEEAEPNASHDSGSGSPPTSPHQPPPRIN
jgi:hypothetical protein